VNRAACYGTLTPGQIFFQGNYARTAGSAVYGGSVDTCFLEGSGWHKGNRFFFKMIQFDKNSTEFSLISSDATRVCICNGTHPDCTILNYTLTGYPGQTLSINAVVVGQGLGTSPGTIHSRFLDSGTEYIPLLGELQSSQVADKHCNNLSYIVDTQKRNKIIATSSRKHSSCTQKY